MSDKQAKHGFTLSELLVVLGLLVAITALTQPALRGALGDSRLRSAANLVRTELAKARLKAMKTGVPRQFRYQLGKGRFETAALTYDDDRQPATSGRESLRLRKPEWEPAETSDEITQLSLPEGTSFDSDQDDDRLTAHPSDDGWSALIVFQPNGRTESARIRIKGEHNSHVEVSLRGLTGVAATGKLKHDEETR